MNKERLTINLGRIRADEILFIAHGTAEQCYPMIRSKLESWTSEGISEKILFKIMAKIVNGDIETAMRQLMSDARERGKQEGITDPAFYSSITSEEKVA